MIENIRTAAGRSMIYLGVDPGLSGGIALLYEGDKVISFPTPRGEKLILEAFDSLEINYGRGQEIFAVIEKIPAGYIGTNKSSMAKLYGSYMALRMALTASMIPFETVHSRSWQKALGIAPRRKKVHYLGEENTYQWKKRLRRIAENTFPQEKVTGATADALLIAQYAKLLHESRVTK